MRRLGLIVFLVLLAAPSLAWLTGQRAVVVENRSLAAWPAPSIEGFASGRWFAALDEALVQRLPLRQLAIDAKRGLLVGLLGERYLDRVVLGDDGTLFLRPTLQSWCGWSAPWNVARRANAALTRRLAGGPDWLWVSVPDKFLLLEDRLPANHRDWGACARARRDRYRQAMEETLGSRFIDLEPALRAFRADQAEGLYLKEDTHWTSRAAVALPRSIVEAWAPGLWDDAAVIDGDTEDAWSDLALQLGLNHQHTVTRQVSRRADVVSRGREQEERARRHGVRTVRHQAVPPARVIPGRTLMVHDSFLLPVTPALAPYFEELVLVQWEELDRRRFERLVSEADRVVFQSVERLVSARQAQKLARWWPPEPDTPN